MATLRKRGPFQWEAQIRRRGYPQQSKTFETRSEAEAWSQMIESEMARGAWVSRSEAESSTLLDLLDRYATEIVPQKKGRNQERSVLNAWRATSLARRIVASIRSSDIAAIRDQWLASFDPATVLRRLQQLSHVFNVARREWGMESISNPLELVRKPAVKNARSRRIANSKVAGKRGRQLTDELDRILAATESASLPAIARLAIETAMRRSEILCLQWEHINLKRRVAHLPTTKNGEARDVPLSMRAVAVLKDLQPRNGKGVRGAVFHLRADAITRAFERAVERAREAYEVECAEAKCEPDHKYLVDLRFHDLRHEATSRLANVYQIHELAKVTGHKDPRMLMRYYHPKAEDLAKKLG